jgi:hypothetical protein
MATDTKSPKAADADTKTTTKPIEGLEEGEEVSEGKSDASAAGASMARKRKKVGDNAVQTIDQC